MGKCHIPHTPHSVGLLFLYGAMDSHPFFSPHVASGRCVLSAAVAGAPADVLPAVAEPSGWCAGAVLDVAAAVCALAVPNSGRTGGCAGCCGDRLTVFAAHAPPPSGRPQPASLRPRPPPPHCAPEIEEPNAPRQDAGRPPQHRPHLARNVRGLHGRLREPPHADAVRGLVAGVAVHDGQVRELRGLQEDPEPRRARRHPELAARAGAGDGAAADQQLALRHPVRAVLGPQDVDDAGGAGARGAGGAGGAEGVVREVRRGLNRRDRRQRTGVLRGAVAGLGRGRGRRGEHGPAPRRDEPGGGRGRGRERRPRRVVELPEAQGHLPLLEKVRVRRDHPRGRAVGGPARRRRHLQRGRRGLRHELGEGHHLVDGPRVRIRVRIRVRVRVRVQTPGLFKRHLPVQFRIDVQVGVHGGGVAVAGWGLRARSGGCGGGVGWGAGR